MESKIEFPIKDAIRVCGQTKMASTALLNNNSLATETPVEAGQLCAGCKIHTIVAEKATVEAIEQATNTQSGEPPIADTSADFDYLPTDERFTTLPIVPARRELWEFYQKAKRAYWTDDELNLVDDVIDFHKKLTDEERHYLKYILGFFAAMDGLVNANLSERFKKEIKITEVTYFYNSQAAIEDIHALTYATMLDTLITDIHERERLLDSVATMPIIGKMAKVVQECMWSTAPIYERLLTMALVEGVLFSGCFAAIYWFGKRGLMPGLAQANELIARDEGMHTDFAILLLNMIRSERRPSTATVHRIVALVTDLAVEFTCEGLPSRLPGMNAQLMTDYIRVQSDKILTQAGYPKLYNCTHELSFMQLINNKSRTNFFERRETNYSKPTERTNTIEEDF
jgi:ribonucleotide reductase beta subunit family protein with ferritin-like domain